MPFQSQAQRRFLYANEPEIAERWERHTPKGKKLPDKVAKMNGDKLRDATRLGRMRMRMHARKGLLGKMSQHKNDYFLHTLIFDKKAFPKQDNVRAWIRSHDHLGSKLGSIADKGGEWHVRQGSPDITGLEEDRIRCDIGVQAIIGMPRTGDSKLIKKSKISGKPQHIGMTLQPGHEMPRFPDWENIYFSPESQKRQDKEAEQGASRRRSMWRDLRFDSLHGPADDKPQLRFDPDRDGRIMEKPLHYLTPEQLRAHRQRVVSMAKVGYEHVQGKSKKK